MASSMLDNIHSGSTSNSGCQLNLSYDSILESMKKDNCQLSTNPIHSSLIHSNTIPQPVITSTPHSTPFVEEGLILKQEENIKVESTKPIKRKSSKKSNMTILSDCSTQLPINRRHLKLRKSLKNCDGFAGRYFVIQVAQSPSNSSTPVASSLKETTQNKKASFDKMATIGFSSESGVVPVVVGEVNRKKKSSNDPSSSIQQQQKGSVLVKSKRRNSFSWAVHSPPVSSIVSPETLQTASFQNMNYSNAVSDHPMFPSPTISHHPPQFNNLHPQANMLTHQRICCHELQDSSATNNLGINFRNVSRHAQVNQIQSEQVTLQQCQVMEELHILNNLVSRVQEGIQMENRDVFSSLSTSTAMEMGCSISQQSTEPITFNQHHPITTDHHMDTSNLLAMLMTTTNQDHSDPRTTQLLLQLLSNKL